MPANTETWYEAKTGNHQGLIISETTGENIAVAYDKKHAQLIAAAPELLRVLKAIFENTWPASCPGPLADQMRTAIDKAEGR